MKEKQDQQTGKGNAPRRYTVISVPTDDSAYWFAYDKRDRRSTEFKTRQEAARFVSVLQSDEDQRRVQLNQNGGQQ
jgi:hypothetical protein